MQQRQAFRQAGVSVVLHKEKRDRQKPTAASERGFTDEAVEDLANRFAGYLLERSEVVGKDGKPFLNRRLHRLTTGRRKLNHIALFQEVDGERFAISIPTVKTEKDTLRVVASYYRPLTSPNALVDDLFRLLSTTLRERGVKRDVRAVKGYRKEQHNNDVVFEVPLADLERMPIVPMELSCELKEIGGRVDALFLVDKAERVLGAIRKDISFLHKRSEITVAACLVYTSLGTNTPLKVERVAEQLRIEPGVLQAALKDAYTVFKQKEKQKELEDYLSTDPSSS